MYDLCNIVNSCVKCTEGIISEELNGKIYSLTYDFDGTAEKSWLSSFFVGITEYGFEEKDKLTIKDSDNGRVRVSRSNPHAGEEVVITLRPEVGYEYGDIKLLDKDGKKIEVKKITDKKIHLKNSFLRLVWAHVAVSYLSNIQSP